MNLKEFIIPAIDIKDKKVVRLYKGDFDKATIYKDSPLDQFLIFKDKGFKRVHIVDLDGAKTGSINFDLVKSFVSKKDDVKIQIGGGIRSYATIKNLLELGIDFVVIGTMAIKNKEEFERALLDFKDKIILSIDAKNGKVSIGGWQEESSFSPYDLVKLYDSANIWGYLYTNIDLDGSLSSVNPKIYEEFKSISKKPLISSGGISSLKDVESLKGKADFVVVGKAIYENKINIDDIK